MRATTGLPKTAGCALSSQEAKARSKASLEAGSDAEIQLERIDIGRNGEVRVFRAVANAMLILKYLPKASVGSFRVRLGSFLRWILP